jgi:hypothetical protein
MLMFDFYNDNSSIIYIIDNSASGRLNFKLSVNKRIEPEGGKHG